MPYLGMAENRKIVYNKYYCSICDGKGDLTLTGIENQKFIDHETAMQYCGGDEEFYRQVLQMYCDEAAELKRALSGYLEQGNWKLYCVEIHGLKSASLNIGCRRLYDVSYELEKACKAEDAGYITENHGPCMQVYDVVVEEAKQYLAAPSEENEV